MSSHMSVQERVGLIIEGMDYERAQKFLKDLGYLTEKEGVPQWTHLGVKRGAELTALWRTGATE
jgi:hypothetical protein